MQLAVLGRLGAADERLVIGARAAGEGELTGIAIDFRERYALGRLERDRKVKVVGVESGEGPERRRYAITRSGVTDLERWLREPEHPEPHLQTVLFSKVVLALLSDRSAHDYLDAQRAAHLQRMRELTVLRRSAPLSQALLADHALFHLEADMRWIDQTTARLEDLREEVSE